MNMRWLTITYACILTATTALSARGKLLDASRTQRLRSTDLDRSVLGMAAAAFALATAEDDDAGSDSRARIADLAAAASRDVATDAALVGRRAADSAFAFHRAGACDVELFLKLERRFVAEIETGTAGLYVSGDDIYPDDSRDSCLDHGGTDGCIPARIVLNAYERLAAAGTASEATANAAAAAAGRLLPRDAPPRLASYIEQLGHENTVRADLWLWRQENRGRQRRRDFRAGGAPCAPPAPPALCDLFADPSLPLCIDLGCGLGAAARGWASDNTRNVLGVDASRSAMHAARARAARDGCGGNLAYAVTDARAVLDAAARYPGPVDAISVQHPTPPDTRGALDWILSPDVTAATQKALAPGGGVLAVETRSERAAAAAREGLAAAGFMLVSDAWPLPSGARSETGGSCVALGWEVERLVFRCV